jgi:hypothetical protein
MTAIVSRRPFADSARFMEVKTLKPKSPSRLEAAMPTDWCGETPSTASRTALAGHADDVHRHEAAVRRPRQIHGG